MTERAIKAERDLGPWLSLSLSPSEPCSPSWPLCFSPMPYLCVRGVMGYLSLALMAFEGPDYSPELTLKRAIIVKRGQGQTPETVTALNCA